MTITAASKKEELSPVARHIARAAARLFAERGYDATSVREIVEAAGVAKPTLYYYFRSKEGLAQALLTVPLTNLVATLRTDRLAGGRSRFSASSRSSRPSTPSAARIPDRAGSFMHSCSARSGRKWPASSSHSRKAWRAGPTRRCAGSRKCRSFLAAASTRAATACRGLIVISTLDYLVSRKPLGRDLARQHVDDLLRGFGDSRYLKELES